MRKQRSLLLHIMGYLCIVSSLLSNSKPPHILSSNAMSDEKQKEQILIQNDDVYTSVSGGIITGKLYNLSENALQSAQVMAWSITVIDSKFEDSLSYSKIISVDSDGVYSISGLEAGDYIVQASAEGYETLYFDHARTLHDAQTVFVNDQDTMVNIDFYMNEIIIGTGSIQGTVLSEEDGKPVDQAIVYAHNKDFSFSGKAITDGLGKYSIEELKSDSYYVYVMADDYLIEYYNDVYDISSGALVTVEEPKAVSGIDFQLIRGGSISGYITDSTGAPITGDYIQAMTQIMDTMVNWTEPWDSRTGYYGTNTDSMGHYKIDKLPPGDYFIRAEHYGGWGNYTSVYYPGVENPVEAVAITVGKNSEITGIDFQIKVEQPIGVIEGNVTDANGNPIKGAVLSLGAYPPWRSARWYWANEMTDSTGHYRLENIPNDAYTVNCYFSYAWENVYYFWPGTLYIEEADPTEISAEHSTWTDINFQLPVSLTRASISGQVRASDGHPLSDAYIQIRPTEQIVNGGEKITPFIWAFSDSNGCYRVDHVPTGSYKIQCYRFENDLYGEQWYNHAESMETAQVISTQKNTRLENIDFDLMMKPMYGSLTGIVLNQQNQPVQNAYVEVIPYYTYLLSGPYYDYMDLTTHTMTDDLGRYSFSKLTHDNYRVVVYANGGYAIYPDAIVWDDAEPVTISGGETATADFKLNIKQYTAAISGRVTVGWDGWYSWYYAGEDSISADLKKQTEVNPQIFVVTAKPTITILSWPESEKVYSAVTTTQGDYTLSCPPGDYYIQAFASNFLPEYYENAYSLSDAKIVSTAPNAPALGINLSLAPKLYWTVEDPANTDMKCNRIYGKVEDEHGNMIAGAVVLLYDENEQPINSVITDETGQFNFSGLNTGDYFLQADKTGLGTVFNGSATSIADSRAISVNKNEIEIHLIYTSSNTGASDIIMPEKIRLTGNIPNPFNPQTEICFELPERSEATLTIYNILGEEMYRHADEYDAGEHRLLWNGQDTGGKYASSGVYFYRLEVGQKTQIRKMILLR